MTLLAIIQIIHLELLPDSWAQSISEIWEFSLQILTCILMDYDAFNPDDEIGRCELSLKDLGEETKDIWLDVDVDAEDDHNQKVWRQTNQITLHTSSFINCTCKDKALLTAAQILLSGMSGALDPLGHVFLATHQGNPPLFPSAQGTLPQFLNLLNIIELCIVHMEFYWQVYASKHNQPITSVYGLSKGKTCPRG